MPKAALKTEAHCSSVVPDAVSPAALLEGLSVTFPECAADDG